MMDSITIAFLLGFLFCCEFTIMVYLITCLIHKNRSRK